MASKAQIDSLLDAVPEPAGSSLGWFFGEQFDINSDRNNCAYGKHRLDAERAKFSGTVRVDSNASVQQGTGAGSPLVHYNNPTGLVPSTIFTPIPRDFIGLDAEYLELIELGFMVTLFGALTGVALAQ